MSGFLVNELKQLDEALTILEAKVISSGLLSRPEPKAVMQDEDITAFFKEKQTEFEAVKKQASRDLLGAEEKEVEESLELDVQIEGNQEVKKEKSEAADNQEPSEPPAEQKEEVKIEKTEEEQKQEAERQAEQEKLKRKAERAEREAVFTLIMSLVHRVIAIYREQVTWGGLHVGTDGAVIIKIAAAFGIKLLSWKGKIPQYEMIKFADGQSAGDSFVQVPCLLNQAFYVKTCIVKDPEFEKSLNALIRALLLQGNMNALPENFTNQLGQFAESHDLTSLLEFLQNCVKKFVTPDSKDSLVKLPKVLEMAKKDLDFIESLLISFSALLGENDFIKKAKTRIKEIQEIQEAIKVAEEAIDKTELCIQKKELEKYLAEESQKKLNEKRKAVSDYAASVKKAQNLASEWQINWGLVEEARAKKEALDVEVKEIIEERTKLIKQVGTLKEEIEKSKESAIKEGLEEKLKATKAEPKKVHRFISIFLYPLSLTLGSAWYPLFEMLEKQEDKPCLLPEVLDVGLAVLCIVDAVINEISQHDFIVSKLGEGVDVELEKAQAQIKVSKEDIAHWKIELDKYKKEAMGRAQQSKRTFDSWNDSIKKNKEAFGKWTPDFENISSEKTAENPPDANHLPLEVKEQQPSLVGRNLDEEIKSLSSNLKKLGNFESELKQLIEGYDADLKGAQDRFSLVPLKTVKKLSYTLALQSSLKKEEERKEDVLYVEVKDHHLHYTLKDPFNWEPSTLTGSIACKELGIPDTNDLDKIKPVWRKILEELAKKNYSQELKSDSPVLDELNLDEEEQKAPPKYIEIYKEEDHESPMPEIRIDSESECKRLYEDIVGVAADADRRAKLSVLQAVVAKQKEELRAKREQRAEFLSQTEAKMQAHIATFASQLKEKEEAISAAMRADVNVPKVRFSAHEQKAEGEEALQEAKEALSHSESEDQEKQVAIALLTRQITKLEKNALAEKEFLLFLQSLEGIEDRGGIKDSAVENELNALLAAEGARTILSAENWHEKIKLLKNQLLISGYLRSHTDALRPLEKELYEKRQEKINLEGNLTHIVADLVETEAKIKDFEEKEVRLPQEITGLAERLAELAKANQEKSAEIAGLQENLESKTGEKTKKEAEKKEKEEKYDTENQALMLEKAEALKKEAGFVTSTLSDDEVKIAAPTKQFSFTAVTSAFSKITDNFKTEEEKNKRKAAEEEKKSDQQSALIMQQLSLVEGAYLDVSAEETAIDALEKEMRVLSTSLSRLQSEITAAEAELRTLGEAKSSKESELSEVQKSLSSAKIKDAKNVNRLEGIIVKRVKLTSDNFQNFDAELEEQRSKVTSLFTELDEKEQDHGKEKAIEEPVQEALEAKASEPRLGIDAAIKILQASTACHQKWQTFFDQSSEEYQALTLEINNLRQIKAESEPASQPEQKALSKFAEQIAAMEAAAQPLKARLDDVAAQLQTLETETTQKRVKLLAVIQFEYRALEEHSGALQRVETEQERRLTALGATSKKVDDASQVLITAEKQREVSQAAQKKSRSVQKPLEAEAAMAAEVALSIAAKKPTPSSWWPHWEHIVVLLFTSFFLSSVAVILVSIFAPALLNLPLVLTALGYLALAGLGHPVVATMMFGLALAVCVLLIWLGTAALRLALIAYSDYRQAKGALSQKKATKEQAKDQRNQEKKQQAEGLLALAEILSREAESASSLVAEFVGEPIVIAKAWSEGRKEDLRAGLAYLNAGSETKLNARLISLTDELHKQLEAAESQLKIDSDQLKSLATAESSRANFSIHFQKLVAGRIALKELLRDRIRAKTAHVTEQVSHFFEVLGKEILYAISFTLYQRKTERVEVQRLAEELDDAFKQHVKDLKVLQEKTIEAKGEEKQIEVAIPHGDREEAQQIMLGDQEEKSGAAAVEPREEDEVEAKNLSAALPQRGMEMSDLFPAELKEAASLSYQKLQTAFAEDTRLFPSIFQDPDAKANSHDSPLSDAKQLGASPASARAVEAKMSNHTVAGIRTMMESEAKALLFLKPKSPTVS